MQVAKNWDRIDALSAFPFLLEERLNLRRQRSSKNLAIYSKLFCICYDLVNEKEKQELVSKIEKNLYFFLDDCSIILEMKEDKAIDALDELSNLITLFSDRLWSEPYNSIHEKIRTIQATYPIQKLDGILMPSMET